MDYKATMQNIRNQARDIARLKAVSKKMAERANVRKDKDFALDLIKTTNHKIDIANYEISKLDKAHPDYDNLLADKNKYIDCQKEMVEHYTDHVVEYDEKLANIDADIAKIESGETKITIEHLNENITAILANLPQKVADGIMFEADAVDN
jgi:chromosome segregation ATPase